MRELERLYQQMYQQKVCVYVCVSMFQKGCVRMFQKVCLPMFALVLAKGVCVCMSQLCVSVSSLCVCLCFRGRSLSLVAAKGVSMSYVSKACVCVNRKHKLTPTV